MNRSKFSGSFGLKKTITAPVYTTSYSRKHFPFSQYLQGLFEREKKYGCTRKKRQVRKVYEKIAEKGKREAHIIRNGSESKTLSQVAQTTRSEEEGSPKETFSGTEIFPLGEEKKSRHEERTDEDQGKEFRGGGEKREGDSPIIVQTKEEKSLQKRNFSRKKKTFRSQAKNLKESDKETKMLQKERGPQRCKSPFLIHYFGKCRYILSYHARHANRYGEKRKRQKVILSKFACRKEMNKLLPCKLFCKTPKSEPLLVKKIFHWYTEIKKRTERFFELDLRRTKCPITKKKGPVIFLRSSVREPENFPNASAWYAFLLSRNING